MDYYLDFFFFFFLLKLFQLWPWGPLAIDSGVHFAYPLHCVYVFVCVWFCFVLSTSLLSAIVRFFRFILFCCTGIIPSPWIPMNNVFLRPLHLVNTPRYMKTYDFFLYVFLLPMREFKSSLLKI